MKCKGSRDYFGFDVGCGGKKKRRNSKYFKDKEAFVLGFERWVSFDQQRKEKGT